ncbi:long-chain fatty acid--CoA ligase [Nocardioides sp. Kera G14]|uniref:long-chain fatty acid--CoA ligase n=1 Tax=Nocardioides sp. Kera G14 TaxID=2884264 RepID=UPI001D12439E|nr:long-chain fatty acid--CoA ligase [Nocardioides sp. Kera G14]UDY24437.1 long-chain fatty acid--CoA ligase [Nocardioides sp. Kera G14]
MARMDGLMQDVPLTVTSILARAERLFPTREVVTKTAAGIERATYADLAREVRRQAASLDRLGLSADARVASFAWNTFRHLALYYSVAGTGRVLHTGNIRYFPEQLIYTFNHAEDEAVFVDRSLLPLISPLLDQLTTLKHVVVMDDGVPNPLPPDPRVIAYEELLTEEEADLEGRVTDEHQAAGICYTSGTTGHPKGVVYSHRSQWLHAVSSLTSSSFGMKDSDRILPVVPFFHANGWGLAHSPLMGGASLVLPGPDMSPAGITSLMESERVTVAAGVPTIWMGVAPLLADHDLSHLRTVICGGSAVPPSLSEAWRSAIGIPITQAWGMTEMSPLGSICQPRAEVEAMSEAEQIDIRATAGFMAPGVEMRIVEPATREEQPWDGEATGELEVRGPWIARQYYRTPLETGPGADFSPDGWLRTGDVASISELGYLKLVDRTKDLVKSGGEWISSVAVENAIMGHPAVAEAAVIASPHPKWGERPLAFAVIRDGQSVSREELLDFLGERLGKWQVPDDVVFIDEVPRTSVGKFSKKTLREKYAGYVLPTA